MYSNVATTKACTLSLLNSLAKRLSARVQIILIWMMGLTFALSPLFGWSYYAPEDSGIRYVKITGPFFHVLLKSQIFSCRLIYLHTAFLQLCSSMGRSFWCIIYHLSLGCRMGNTKSYHNIVSNRGPSLSKKGILWKVLYH